MLEGVLRLWYDGKMPYIRHIEPYLRHIVIGLSVALVLLGGYLFLFPDQPDFADVASYEDARKTGDLSHTAPALPVCATDIDVVESGGSVAEVSFLCANESMRAAFVTDLRTQFEWDVSVYEGEKVVMQRAE